MDQGFATLFRALPTQLELVLFVWSSEAFAHALRCSQSNEVTLAASECPMRSAHGRWALVPGTTGTEGSGRQPLALRSLIGLGPHWVIINMACYVTRESPLDLFTEASVAVGQDTKMVSSNTPEYALRQLRRYQGQLPPSVYWLSEGCERFEKELLALKPVKWWNALLQGTRVDASVLPDNFDPDFWFLPEAQQPQSDE